MSVFKNKVLHRPIFGIGHYFVCIERIITKSDIHIGLRSTNLETKFFFILTLLWILESNYASIIFQTKSLNLLLLMHNFQYHSIGPISPSPFKISLFLFYYPFWENIFWISQFLALDKSLFMWNDILHYVRIYIIQNEKRDYLSENNWYS